MEARQWRGCWQRSALALTYGGAAGEPRQASAAAQSELASCHELRLAHPRQECFVQLIQPRICVSEAVGCRQHQAWRNQGACRGYGLFQLSLRATRCARSAATHPADLHRT